MRNTVKALLEDLRQQFEDRVSFKVKTAAAKKEAKDRATALDDEADTDHIPVKTRRKELIFAKSLKKSE